jgi:hypothetical protein
MNQLAGCSSALLRPIRPYKLVWYVCHRGIQEARKFLRFRSGHAVSIVQDETASDREGSHEFAFEESLRLQPGELVTVRSEEEILSTLDRFGRNRGLYWMPMMREYCGQTFPVYKRVDRIVLENTGEIRKLRNTVLLDGVLCDGLYGCDRSCFHFWREVWLRRANGDSAD